MNYAQDQLLAAMHSISEDAFAAGWRTDLELILWSAVAADGRHLDAAGVSEDDVRHIRDLADQARGWWVHCNTVGKDWNAGEVAGREFVPIRTWLAMYEHLVIVAENP